MKGGQNKSATQFSPPVTAGRRGQHTQCGHDHFTEVESPDCRHYGLAGILRRTRLRDEKLEIEDRLREIEPAPVCVTNPEIVVETIHEELSDASCLFEHGIKE